MGNRVCIFTDQSNMLRSIYLTFVAIIFINCNNSSEPSAKPEKRIDISPPEPDKDLREKWELKQRLKQLKCSLSDPDTSLAGIKLRDANSTTAIIGENEKYYQDKVYHYYSKNKNEILSMVTHPGDGNHSISIFNVRSAGKTKYPYKTLNVDHFKTEKGIMLGLNKEQIISKLGNCYVVKDRAKRYMELYYRIEAPSDSRTKLLESQNMPIYYASYIFRNDKLQKFEFGFEYP